MSEMRNKDNETLLAEVEEILGRGGCVRMRVKGGSMRPFLGDGRDEVILVPVDTAALRIGMVILFRYDGRYVLHRICRINNDMLITAGDGNYRISETALRSAVVCYAGQVVRKGKMIRYGSPRWHSLTAWSIFVKICRTTYRDICNLRS